MTLYYGIFILFLFTSLDSRRRLAFVVAIVCLTTANKLIIYSLLTRFPVSFTVCQRQYIKLL